MNSAGQLGNERVEIGCAVNRILAEDVKSDMDIPPFDKSAMDGFACRREDLANELAIIETIPAGVSPKREIGPRQCAKIMTGAMVPQGADCVIMVEFTENCGENKVRFTGKKTADNICGKAENIKAGQIVLCKGVRIKPQHIATLASVGCARPLVASRPAVGIIATGNELVTPAEKPAISQIRDSNSFQLCAQAQRLGAIGRNYGVAADTETEINGVLKKAIAENDVVVISGGVSMGDYDLVPGILKQNGVKVLFEKLAIKPGKPTVFGVCGGSSPLSRGQVCFGLPGSPAAGFVIFELLVKPFLYKMMGHDYNPFCIPVAMAESVKRKKTERQSWIPVTITKAGTAKPVEYHGSAHINALCEANGLVSLDIGVAEIEKGIVVPVRIFGQC